MSKDGLNLINTVSKVGGVKLKDFLGQICIVNLTQPKHRQLLLTIIFFYIKKIGVEMSFVKLTSAREILHKVNFLLVSILLFGLILKIA